jgi:hypothetical protein
MHVGEDRDAARIVVEGEDLPELFAHRDGVLVERGGEIAIEREEQHAVCERANPPRELLRKGVHANAENGDGVLTHRPSIRMRPCGASSPQRPGGARRL